MKTRVFLFLLGAGALLMVPTLGHAGTCNITASTPAAGAAVRGTVSISWVYSGGCNNALDTVAVTVTRPAAAGGGTFSLGTVTRPVDTVSWVTGGTYGDAAGYVITLTPGGTSPGSAKTISPITVDNTAPVLSAGTRNVPANGFGWNNTDVTVTWPCTDATSGVNGGASTLSVTKSADGANQTATATCVDNAGNSSTANVTGISIDKTAPTIALLSRTAANGDGWNNGPVSITWSCTDALSGADTAGSTLAATVSTEGAGQSRTGTCKDKAGNTATNTQSGINIDATAPVATFASRTPANANGWNNTDVTVTWNCSDALSGPASPTATATVTTDGSNQSASASCADLAGNSASASQGDINIDTAAPVIALLSRTPANGNGWNNGPVSITWSCADALSGADAGASTLDATVSADGEDQSASGTCADLAGNTAGDTQSGINIDAAAPVPTFASRTPANDNGWNNGPVTVTWNCTDALSGPASPTASATVSTDGAGQTASASCSDLAGNSATAAQGGIEIDTVAPTITFASRTPANGNGWNSGDVTVVWDCDDALSGPAAATATDTVTAEGAAQSASGQCADLAGNTAGDTQTGISIDRTEPAIALLSRTAANAEGWNNTAVALAWECSDALSGVDADASTLAATVATDGENQSASGTCADAAGNSASDQQTGINIDTVAPGATLASRTPANGNGWNNSDVTVVWDCDDALSGPAAATTQATVTTEGSGQTANAECADLAGNTTTASQGEINIDRTEPAIVFASRTPANGNGWNNDDVTVTWDCVDALSGPEAASVSDTVTSEGENQSASAECADLAGNTAADTRDGIDIDRTAPTIALASRTPANGNGWNNGDVTVTWNCDDALSGPAAATVSTTVTTDGENQPASGTCADLAGNTAADTQDGINIDTAAPTISFASRTPANANGWNNGDVTVTWDCDDALSGPAAATVSATVTAEGEDRSASGTCADLAGNTAGDTHGGIDIDRTAPSITFTSRTPANANGWNNGDVTVEWACDDALSGVEAASVTETVTGDGENRTATGDCADRAGNHASDTQDGINIDTAAPSITLASRTPANADGWNDGDVTVVWDCEDALSGAAQATVSQTVTSEGANQSASGTCTDLAGNESSATQGGINIDKGAPSASIGPDLLYLRVLGNTMTLTGTDAGSSVKSMSVTLTGLLGGSQTLDGVCVAGCGTSSATFRVDLTPLEGLGVFTAQATAVDRAGNESAPSATATVVIV